MTKHSLSSCPIPKSIHTRTELRKYVFNPLKLRIHSSHVYHMLTAKFKNVALAGLHNQDMVLHIK